jgi:hypothetical protein
MQVGAQAWTLLSSSEVERDSFALVTRTDALNGSHTTTVVV